MKPDRTDILIIGAGISGMLCASELSKTTRTIRILEKGRGFGGRMATRRMAGGRLDHGAQYFTVRDARFQKYVDRWLNAGVIKEWFRKIPEDTNPEGYPRYCGVSGMTDVCKHLAQGLEVQRSERVVELLKETDQWLVRTDSGNQFVAKQLVMTSPLPQSLALLDATGLEYAGDDLSSLRAVEYDKGLATLAILDGASGLPGMGATKVHEGPLTWIADNQIKGISSGVSAVTLHANAEFAAEHWDSLDAVRGELMLEAAKPYLKSEVKEFKCHRWGFTLPVNPLEESYFHNSELNLTIAGDAFGGPRIEGAALSGMEAAAAVGRALDDQRL